MKLPILRSIHRGIFGMVAVLLTFPLALAASTFDAARITPELHFFGLNIKLTGKTLERIQPFISEALKEAKKAGDELGVMMLEKLNRGEDFALSFGPAKIGEDVASLMSAAVTDKEWEKILKLVKNNPSFSERKLEGRSPIIYTIPGVAFSNVGSHVIAASTEELLKNALDLYEGKTTESWTNSAWHARAKSKLITGALVSGLFNVPAFPQVLELAGGVNTEVNSLESVVFNVAEIPTGYRFLITSLGNESLLKEKNVSLNAGGSNVPYLYQKFPNAPVIYYAEGYNFKTNYEKSLDLQLSSLDESQKELIAPQIEQFKTYTEPFDKGLAMAIQRDPNSVIPFITLMADVSSNVEKTKELIAPIKDFVQQSIVDTSPEGSATLTEEDGLLHLKIDLSKIEGSELKQLIDITWGVTADGRLVFSNYPGIEKASGTSGLLGDSDFAAAYTDRSQAVQGIAYISVRNIFAWIDEMIKLADPGLESLRDYYAFVNLIYGWKDLFLVSKATDYEAEAEARITLDSAKHASYGDLVSALQEKDSDQDGLTDFVEEYVLYMDPEESDSDGDGKLDAAEKPEEEFVDSKALPGWAKDEIGVLVARGCVKGYGDNSFKAEREINRAEFVAIMVRCFEAKLSRRLGEATATLDVLGSRILSFHDVPHSAWYYRELSKACSLGWVDCESIPRNFRPTDPVKREEAIKILTKASQFLQQAEQGSCQELPFSDVPKTHWSCSYVATAAQYGVTCGIGGKAKENKAACESVSGKFGLNEFLNRAQAAALIDRALDLDIGYLVENAPTASDTGLPTLLRNAMPLSSER